MDALKEVSKVWLVAKMVHTLFLSILGNKVLEERLQKAAGKRHKKVKLESQPAGVESPPRSRFDDLTLGYPTGPPAPQVSYERSRPQTPANVLTADANQSMAAPSSLSPKMRQNGDNGFGAANSRSNTRPTTPFNAAYSIPETPPDLYLVTRSSPPISQNLYENFQPDQLFPESSNMNLMNQFGLSQNLDPALQMPQMHTPTMQHRQMAGDSMQGVQMGGLHQDTSWVNQLSPEDTWSNSSRGQGPVAPETLNVEDW
jgi:hypothetical protein